MDTEVYISHSLWKHVSMRDIEEENQKYLTPKCIPSYGKDCYDSANDDKYHFPTKPQLKEEIHYI